MFKKILSISIVFLAIISQSGIASAQGGLIIKTPKINPAEGGIDNKIYLPGANTESNQGQILQKNLLPSVTTLVISITGGLSLLFVIVGAVQILTAFGGEEGLTSGKKTITWALVGLVISLLSFAIVQIVTSIDLTPQKATQNGAK